MPNMAQRDLRRVATRAAQLEKARVELRDAIRQAHESGESVRDIAPYAGLSPSRVFELLREAQDR
jgi:hypothetical protein